MKLLVVGGCGFLGSNLASHGIELGWDVTIFDNLSRVGSTLNLQWLQSLGKVNFIHGDTAAFAAKGIETLKIACALAISISLVVGIPLPRRKKR